MQVGAGVVGPRRALCGCQPGAAGTVPLEPVGAGGRPIAARLTSLPSSLSCFLLYQSMQAAGPEELRDLTTAWADAKQGARLAELSGTLADTA